MSAALTLAITVGATTAPVQAVPPEAGEGLAAAAQAAVENGSASSLVSDVAAGAARAAATGPVGKTPLPVGGGPAIPPLNMPQPGKPPAPGHPPIYMPLARPMTPTARTMNSFGFAAAFGMVCLNAYWGSPIALVGCSAMVVAWFARYYLY